MDLDGIIPSEVNTFTKELTQYVLTDKWILAPTGTTAIEHIFSIKDFLKDTEKRFF